MTNDDITFVLPTDYKEIDNSYIKREYIYDFSFHVHVSTVDTIKKIEVYKNGILYNDVIVNSTGTNYYYIKDLNVINKGNYHYGIKITLNDNKVYKNGFYLKIQDSFVENDIKLVYFATQGTHENFNMLAILAKFESNYNIHSVKLYRKYLNGDWTFLGDMQKNIDNYKYKDLLFDVSMNKKEIFYKVKVLTSNNLCKTAVIEVPIEQNTFSINNISYMGNTYDKYSIYGGLVCNIISPQSSFNNKIFEFFVDSSENRFLRINIKNKKYFFYSENYEIKYPDKFIQQQTNESKNTFYISGRGIAKQIVDDLKDIEKTDSCEFNCTINCGNDYSITFNIHPDTDNALQVSTEETLNNIVRYKDLYLNTENTYEDKTISNVKHDGILTYKDNLKFLDSSLTERLLPIDQPKIDALFKNSDFSTYNNYNFYFISYSDKGIDLTVFDGINYDEINYELNIYTPTLEYIKNNVCFKFSSDDKIEFEFVNYDLTKNFQIVTIKDNQLNICSCNDSVSIIFNEMRIQLLDKLNQIYYYFEDNTSKSAKFSRNYLLKEQLFESMDFDNFIQNMYMYEFRLAITTIAETNGIEQDAELFMNATVNMGRSFFDIEKTDINYKIGTFITNNESYNQKPVNIMEKLNDTYYIKLDQSLKTKNKNDYGHYVNCGLYNQNALIYKLSLSDIELESFFTYKDTCKARIVKLNNDELYLFFYKNNKYIVNVIDLQTASRKNQFILDSKISCQYLLSLSDEQLLQFSNILSIAKQNEFVDRKMKIYCLSDYDSVLMIESGKEIFFKKITAINNSQEYNSFVYEYNINYPLNIKNRNAFLQEIELEGRNK